MLRADRDCLTLSGIGCFIAAPNSGRQRVERYLIFLCLLFCVSAQDDIDHIWPKAAKFVSMTVLGR